ncbi:MAG: NUDIX hydrolase [Pseudomonadota bacterium]|nr:NUDIX hydrolase [Pseudomonadota bacterium]
MQTRWKPSVTVAAIVERTQGGVQQFLLVEEDTPEGLRLNNPAGHLDPGESPQQGVVREALEETARVFTPEHVVGIYLSRFARPATGEDVTYLRIAFGGSAGEPQAGRALDDGIVRTLWLSLQELRDSEAQHRSPLVLRCILDFVAGRRYPLDLLQCDPSVYAPEIKGG